MADKKLIAKIDPDEISQLLAEGYTEEEVTQALVLSLEAPTKVEAVNIEEIKSNEIRQLMNDGFTKEQAIQAIKMSLQHSEKNQNGAKHLCICGQPLVITSNVYTLYNNSGRVYCDYCRTTANKNDTYWHCQLERIPIHKSGFDICDNCINKYDPIAMKRQRNVLQIKNKFPVSHRKRLRKPLLLPSMGSSVGRIRVIGKDENESTITDIHHSQLIYNGNVNPKLYIMSKINTALIVVITFTTPVMDLQELDIYFSSESPKQNEQQSEYNINKASDISIFRLNKLNDYLNLDHRKPDQYSRTTLITSDEFRITEAPVVSFKDISRRNKKFESIKYLAISMQPTTSLVVFGYIKLLCDVECPIEIFDTIHRFLCKVRIYFNAIQFLGNVSASRILTPIYDDVLTESDLKLRIKEIEEMHDKQNQQEINKYNEEHKNDQLKLCPDSKYLLEQSKCLQTKCECEQLCECVCLKRLVNTMTLYNEFISEREQKGNDKLNMKCENTDILNDFHHLLDFHSEQFEDICNLLPQCNFRNCLMLRRNHRNRLLFTSNDCKLEEMYLHCSDIHDIVQQQILDKIHCYYTHSFDTGHKIRRDDMKNMTESIANDENIECYDRIVKQINNYQIVKKKAFENVNGLETLQDTNKNSKFCTTVSVAEIRYSNGIRYFYWPFYKTRSVTDAGRWIGVVTDDNKFANEGYTMGEWYIDAKYENLKNELLNNEICTISTKQWDAFVEKACVHLLTAHCKDMRCKKNLGERIYNIKYDAPITENHLIAIMIHCNTNELQRKFAETFRRIPADETDESIIERHRNYAHLGRILRECVDCFGTNVESEHWKIGLWHGINIEANFSSLTICIKGPVSTSTDLAVATSFCNNEGLILNFGLNRFWSHEINKEGMAMFDCCWISDYVSEKEVFFIGGYANFLINTIIIPKGINYNIFVTALNKLFQIFDSYQGILYQQNTEMDEKIINQVCYRILAHQLHLHYPNDNHFMELKSMPLYVKRLVNSQFNNITNIDLNYNIINRDSAVEKFIKLSLFYNNGFVDLNKWSKLFPSLKYIKINSFNRSLLVDDDFVYLTILQHLKSNKQLRHIGFFHIQEKGDTQKLQKIWGRFNSHFSKIRWKMSVTRNGTITISFQSLDNLPPLFFKRKKAKKFKYAQITQ